MANDLYYFRGISKWAKLQKPDPKFGNFTLDVYLDKPSFKLLKESGLQLKIRDSEEGTYVKFRRAVSKVVQGELRQQDHPTVLLQNDDGMEAFTGNVGNGSLVVCKVRVYDTLKGKGHELESVLVETLVPFDSTEEHMPDGDTLPF